MTVRDSRVAEWLVGSLRTGLVAIDERGQMAALSAEAARILGCREPAGPSVLGRPCREVLAAQPRVAALLADALDGRERPSRAELRLELVAEGEPRTIGYTLIPVRNGSGAVRGAAMWFLDLTPFERMDEQERLRERLRALGQMAAGLAHEIRNPLASMEVLAGLLKRSLGDRPDELSLVEELLQELRSLAATVHASLDFVRPTSLQSEEVDLVALVEACLARSRARVPFEGRVELSAAPGLSSIVGDPEQLRRAITNLLVNALQAMAAMRREGGHLLRIGVEPEREGRRGLCVSISDTGPGVPEELHERIFYPFFTTREDGSGVGLAEAQKVVASHGGSIELASRDGAGSTFRVRLPEGEPEP